MNLHVVYDYVFDTFMIIIAFNTRRRDQKGIYTIYSRRHNNRFIII